jgi:hypothetical protein
MREVAAAARVRPVPEIVVLGRGEIELGAYVAHRRTIENFNAGARERYGASTEFGGFAYHLIGCLGELATAKYLNMYWTGSELGKLDNVDVGGCVQVRATSTNGHRLVLHKEDDDLFPFVLPYVLSDRLPSVALVGWLRAKDGKREQHWCDPGTGRPAYFVPNELLLPMCDLKL